MDIAITEQQEYISPFEKGRKVILDFVKTLPQKPGVYRMLNPKGEALYVGKAKNLKKRVVSYTYLNKLPNRLQRMVAETIAMEIVTTQSEVEALLLESNLIKKLQPRYNILLKDDKSFPYVLLTGHAYPRVMKYRGPKQKGGQYFGPFANVAAVDEAILTMQKVFRLRNCSDSYYENRSRPCLQYHIKRCSAPCVGKISEAEYAESVKYVKQFLKGKSATVQKNLADAMFEASMATNFEKAAQLRDSIRLLTSLQARQRINVTGINNADVFSIEALNSKACVQGFFFRHGRNYGAQHYMFNQVQDIPLEEILTTFLQQFYNSHEPPNLIIVSHKIADVELLEESLHQQYKNKVKIELPKNGTKYDLVQHASLNAKQLLTRLQNEDSGLKNQFIALEDFLDYKPINTIEVYDNSHLQGSQAYGVLICAGRDGFIKDRYRKFKIRDAKLDFGGDDFAMMREVMTRRLAHKNEWPLPDVMLIDGGKGQVSSVFQTMQENDLADKVLVVGIAKGEKRNAGEETFHFIDKTQRILPPNSSLLYFLQTIRDEAHRFAIGTHRAGRAKKLVTSELENIPGVGKHRKKLLMHHFGSVRSIRQAGIEDIKMVAGINHATAEKIYYYFHQG